MRDLNYQLKQLGRRNRDGSFATQADRERMLALFANQLHEAGYRHMRPDSLKPKHVEALLERWKAEEISAGTMKNRLAALRWWAEKIGKENVIARNKLPSPARARARARARSPAARADRSSAARR